MNNRFISSIGLAVVFLASIIGTLFNPNALTMGQFLMLGGFFSKIFGLLHFAVFFASIAGVIILITI